MRGGVNEVGVNAHNLVLVLGDVVGEELIKGDLQVLAVLHVETLDELLGLLFVDHFKDRVDVLLVLNRQLLRTRFGVNLLLHSLDLLDLYLLALHEGLQNHEDHRLVIGEEAVLDSLDRRVQVDLVKDTLEEGNPHGLAVGADVVVLLLDRVFVHLGVSSETQHKSLQHQCDLVLHNRVVLNVRTNTIHEHSLQDC